MGPRSRSPSLPLQTGQAIAWSTLAEDEAARAFGLGFYRSIAKQLKAGARRATKPGHHASRGEPPSMAEQASFKSRASRLSMAAKAHAHADEDGLFASCARWCRKCCGREHKVDTRSFGQRAFDAGVESFLEHGFRFGDPTEYFHPPDSGHEHLRVPDFSGKCPQCTPPVHGKVVFLTCRNNNPDDITETYAENPAMPRSRTTRRDDSRRRLTTRARSRTSVQHD